MSRSRGPFCGWHDYGTYHPNRRSSAGCQIRRGGATAQDAPRVRGQGRQALVAASRLRRQCIFPIPGIAARPPHLAKSRQPAKEPISWMATAVHTRIRAWLKPVTQTWAKTQFQRIGWCFRSTEYKQTTGFASILARPAAISICKRANADRLAPIKMVTRCSSKTSRFRTTLQIAGGYISRRSAAPKKHDRRHQIQCCLPGALSIRATATQLGRNGSRFICELCRNVPPGRAR